MAGTVSTRLTVVSQPATHDKDPKHERYNRTSKGKARTRQGESKRSEGRIAAYLAKPFVAWDGEGGNESDGSHTYFLLANSCGESLSDRNGLSTVSVFELFLNARTGVTNIIYGGGYDFNMLLRDFDRETLEVLYSSGIAYWNRYRVEWRGGKSFSVSKGKRRFLLYDILPFFQRSFVSACDEYLGTDWPYRDEIIREKSNRGNFDWTQLETIAQYNRAELSTLVALANELRQRLYQAQIRVARWDGPGAIATALYQKHKTKSYLDSPPNAVAEAGRIAYSGGRFEIIRKGHSDSPAYQYDIRSAYPDAIRYLPCLAHGRWEYRSEPTSIVPYGIYRVSTDTALEPRNTIHRAQPQPLWMRNPNGTVYYNLFNKGWYWSPEASMALELGGHTIHEGWEWKPDCNHRPFAFVPDLYDKRQRLKSLGDGSQVAYKLGLNSLYGKLAQQVGWDEGPPLRLPPYHSLEWAGWITSYCRAKVYRASLHAPDDIIAFETDAVFSRVPLDLDLGEGLGQWEETVYESLTYLKSGMYWATKNGSEIEKCRGINKGTLTRQSVIDALARSRHESNVTLMAEQTRFVGLGQALFQDFGKWRKWITSPREIKVMLHGKRMDVLSGEDNRKITGDGWEETEPGFGSYKTKYSRPYEVAWIKREEDLHNFDGKSLEEVRIQEAHESGLGYYE